MSQLKSTDDVASILWQASQLADKDEQQAYLDQACASRPELRNEVDDLLEVLSTAKAEQRPLLQRLDAVAEREGIAWKELLMPSTTPLPSDDLDVETCELTEAKDPFVGERVGPYKIRERLGEGGFGAVYVAEQEKPIRRKIAMKLIKPGMDSKQIIARFEAERQALAMMDHPNIAKVLDAGTTDDGRPYFVMELVNGVSITEYTEKQGLSISDRLRLMKSVCVAVEHAHKKGIIHRDLKPSNVLVTLHDGDPVVKVIDFGVAKALHQKLSENTVYTAMGQMVGTPMYMSPEQAEMSGLDVDTRSDVYSLGVLLYELLTGLTPFDRDSFRQAGFEAMLEMIRDTDPPKPSLRVSTAATARESSRIDDHRRVDSRRLSTSLKGELDWIVMKALEKQRDRRYQSAREFALDLGNYLSEKPVTARPASWTYSARKYLSRHRRRLGFVAAVTLLLTSSIGIWVSATIQRTSLRLQQTADRERRVATVEQTLTRIEQQTDAQQWSEAFVSLEKFLQLPDAALVGTAKLLNLKARRAELQLISELESAQLQGSLWTEDGFDFREAERAFDKSFREFGVSIDPSNLDEVFDELRGRVSLTLPVVSALDAWALMVNEIESQTGSHDIRTPRGKRPSNLPQTSRTSAAVVKADYYAGGLVDLTPASRSDTAIEAPFALGLLRLAGRLDSDPLRKRIRESVSQVNKVESKTVLVEIARNRTTSTLPTPTLRLLTSALLLFDQKELALSILRKANVNQPDNFWIAYSILTMLDTNSTNSLLEHVRFASSALATRPDNVWLLNYVGTVSHRLGRPDEAKNYYRRAQFVNQNFLVSKTNLAIVYRREGDIAAAKEVLEDTLQHNPGYAPGLAHLSLIYSLEGKYNEAAATRQKAYRHYPDPLYILQFLVYSLFFDGQYEECSRVIEEALSAGIELFGDDYTMFAEMLVKQNKRERAITFFEKAHDAGFYREYGKQINLLHYSRTLHQLNRKKEAYECLQRAIESAPARAMDRHLVVGDLHLSAAKILLLSPEIHVASPEKALDHAELAVKVFQTGGHSKRYVSGWQTLADALFASERYVEALDAFHTHLNLKFGAGSEASVEEQVLEQVVARALETANALKDDGKFDQALLALQAVQGIAPDHADPYVNQGMTLRYWLTGENHDIEAIKLFQTAIQVDPDWPPGHDQLARVLANSNNPTLRLPSQALRHARIARKLLGNPPFDAYSLSTLGMAEYRMGMYSEAIETIGKAFEAQESAGKKAYAPISIFLAMSHFHLGNRKEARQWYDRSLLEVAARNQIFKTTLEEAQQLFGQEASEN